MLDGFSIDRDEPSRPLNRWLTAMPVLFRPQIERLLIERDRSIERWQAGHSDADVFEDPRLEVTSSLEVRLYAHIKQLFLQGDAVRIEDAIRRNYLGDRVETSHNSFLVNTGTKLILVDAGAGSLLGPTTGQLLSNLRASGYQPEHVDEIYLTHLHTDHVGGLMAEDQQVFPNAIVRVNKRDTDYWLSEANMRAAPAEAKRFFQGAMVSIAPYMRAGKLIVFEGDAELVPGVRAQTAYGHTPGHTMYAVESRGEKLLLWGDVVHVAAVQFEDPSVTIRYDLDVSEAEHVHELAFADAAKNGYLVGGAHISFPGLGARTARRREDLHVCALELLAWLACRYSSTRSRSRCSSA
jgi:glyoxylase-like metal-dependent hydrolase (beta-lactamase superfamily II)